jgi:hypothetical protein
MTVSLTRGGLPSAVVARLVPAAPIVWRIALVLVVGRTSPATRAHARRFKTTESAVIPVMALRIDTPGRNRTSV